MITESVSTCEWGKKRAGMPTFAIKHLLWAPMAVTSLKELPQKTGQKRLHFYRQLGSSPSSKTDETCLQVFLSVVSGWKSHALWAHTDIFLPLAALPAPLFHLAMSSWICTSLLSWDHYFLSGGFKISDWMTISEAMGNIIVVPQENLKSHRFSIFKNWLTVQFQAKHLQKKW